MEGEGGMSGPCPILVCCNLATEGALGVMHGHIPARNWAGPPCMPVLPQTHLCVALHSISSLVYYIQSVNMGSYLYKESYF